MTRGADLVVDSLVSLGQDVAFILPGFGIQPLAEAFDARRDEIRMVTALNETNLGLIANGYAQGSGKPAFASVYHSSGTALAMMALTTAWADQVPLVLTSTTTSRANAGRDGYAAVPRALTEMSQQYTKWSAEVNSAARIPELLERAFAIAATPPMGPVHLAFPMDIYLEDVPHDDVSHVRERIPAPVVPDSAAIAEAVSHLRSARRPLIIAGGEVTRYGAADALLRFAERLGAGVVVEEFPSRLPFPTTHPLFLGNVSEYGDLAAYDLVLACGAEFTEKRDRHALASPAQTLIQLSAGAAEILKQIRPDLILAGDLRLTLDSLRAKLDQEAVPALPSADVSKIRSDRANRIDVLRRQGWDSSPLRAGRLIAELEEATRGCIIVNQAGTNAIYLDMFYPFPDPELYFGLSARGSAQGWAVPAGIGIQLADTERRVVVFVGDGGFMFSSTAIYTAAQRRLPMVFVVVDNRGWRDIAASSRSIAGRAHEREQEHGWTFDMPPIDHAAYVHSLGLTPYYASSPAEFRDALHSALDQTGPAVVIVDSDPADVDFHFAEKV